MPIRPGDTVQFVGQGPSPTPTSHLRHDPNGDPQPGDYGEVLSVQGDQVRVTWKFGATAVSAIDDLVKWHHVSSKAHRYRVLFERMKLSDDVTYTVVTKGGEAKAIWRASIALARDRPDYGPFAVEVEDLGTDFSPEASDLPVWDEVM